MNEITYDKVLDEKNPKVKQLYWDIAFGLQEVDGLKPSNYMIELSVEHIEGKKTYKQVQDAITSYYAKNVNNHDIFIPLFIYSQFSSLDCFVLLQIKF